MTPNLGMLRRAICAALFVAPISWLNFAETAAETVRAENTESTVSVPATSMAEITETVTRIEDTGVSITYAGHWQRLSGEAWSGGTLTSGGVVDDTGGPVTKATLSFEGTGVRWLGKRGPAMGFASVFLDGRLAATVDAYAPREAAGAVLFTASGLAAAAHTLVIHVEGKKNSHPRRRLSPLPPPPKTRARSGWILPVTAARSSTHRGVRT